MRREQAMSESPSAGAVRLSIEGPVANVLFDRPAARNAMTWQMYAQLGDICDELRANKGVRVACLRGAGGEAFVAGTDISQFAAFKDGADGVEYERGIDAGVAKLESLPIPTVAAVEGWCVGGGLALATACDVRIANPAAKFGVPIAKTLGNCLSITNIARLVAVFGKPRVQRMLIGAEMLDAQEALACGYLAKVTDDVDTQAKALCERLAALAPVTQAVSKEALSRLLVHSLPEARELIERAYGSEDFHEGVRAFGEKRAPRWQGK